MNHHPKENQWNRHVMMQTKNIASYNILIHTCFAFPNLGTAWKVIKMIAMLRNCTFWWNVVPLGYQKEWFIILHHVARIKVDFWRYWKFSPQITLKYFRMIFFFNPYQKSFWKHGCGLPQTNICVTDKSNLHREKESF